MYISFGGVAGVGVGKQVEEQSCWGDGVVGEERGI